MERKHKHNILLRAVALYLIYFGSFVDLFVLGLFAFLFVFLLAFLMHTTMGFFRSLPYEINTYISYNINNNNRNEIALGLAEYCWCYCAIPSHMFVACVCVSVCAFHCLCEWISVWAAYFIIGMSSSIEPLLISLLIQHESFTPQFFRLRFHAFKWQPAIRADSGYLGKEQIGKFKRWKQREEKTRFPWKNVLR